MTGGRKKSVHPLLSPLVDPIVITARYGVRPLETMLTSIKKHYAEMRRQKYGPVNAYFNSVHEAVEENIINGACGVIGMAGGFWGFAMINSALIGAGFPMLASIPLGLLGGAVLAGGVLPIVAAAALCVPTTAIRAVFKGIPAFLHGCGKAGLFITHGKDEYKKITDRLVHPKTMAPPAQENLSSEDMERYIGALPPEQKLGMLAGLKEKFPGDFAALKKEEMAQIDAAINAGVQSDVTGAPIPDMKKKPFHPPRGGMS